MPACMQRSESPSASPSHMTRSAGSHGASIHPGSDDAYVSQPNEVSNDDVSGMMWRLYGVWLYSCLHSGPLHYTAIMCVYAHITCMFSLACFSQHTWHNLLGILSAVYNTHKHILFHLPLPCRSMVLHLQRWVVCEFSARIQIAVHECYKQSQQCVSPCMSLIGVTAVWSLFLLLPACYLCVNMYVGPMTAGAATHRPHTLPDHAVQAA